MVKLRNQGMMKHICTNQYNQHISLNSFSVSLSLACRVESNSFILISQFFSFGGDERFLGEAFRVAVLSGFGDFCST